MDRADLARAIADAATWREVLHGVGLAPGSSTTAVRRRARVLDLDTRHLDPRPELQRTATPEPRQQHLCRAAAMIAAAWFELSGARVAWPLEPSRYDLLVDRGGALARVQVKASTVRARHSWLVRLTAHRGRPYQEGEIDSFFVIGGDLSLYLIPYAEVADRASISTAAYTSFRLPPLALLEPLSAACASPEA